MAGERPRYKFQRLHVYQLGLDFLDAMYQLTKELPKAESLNLRPQLERAATSIVLNFAEGSTGQTDREQSRFLGLALRSLMECVACVDIAERHRYVRGEELTVTRELGRELFARIQAMRSSLEKNRDLQAGRRSPVAGRN